jgi:LSD1 subclass zinc finger protein
MPVIVALLYAQRFLMNETNRTVVTCQGCQKQLRLPIDKGALAVRCPVCRNRWSWTPPGLEGVRMPGADYYEILQVSPLAQLEVIQAAYGRLALKYHPDRNPGDPSADQMMKLLNEAKDTLCNPERRKIYDAQRERPTATAKSYSETRKSCDTQREGPASNSEFCFDDDISDTPAMAEAGQSFWPDEPEGPLEPYEGGRGRPLACSLCFL